MNNKITLLLLVLPLLFSHADVYSQIQIQRFISGSGGTNISGSNNRISGTLGQLAVGKSESINNRVDIGFWYTYSALTSVKNEEHIPLEFHMSQNYPNPFNPSTKIKYELAEEVSATLKIFNMLGEEIAVLVNSMQSPGRYEVIWNASERASGFYICRLEAGKNVSVKKLILLK